MTSERGVTPGVDRFSVPPDKLSGISPDLPRCFSTGCYGCRLVLPASAACYSLTASLRTAGQSPPNMPSGGGTLSIGCCWFGLSSLCTLSPPARSDFFRHRGRNPEDDERRMKSPLMERWTLCLLLACCGCGSQPTLPELALPRDLDAEIRSLVDDHLERVRADPSDAEKLGQLGLVFEANALWRQAGQCFEAGGVARPPGTRLALPCRPRHAEPGDFDGAVAAMHAAVKRFPGFAPRPAPSRGTADRVRRHRWGGCSVPARRGAAGEVPGRSRRSRPRRS